MQFSELDELARKDESPDERSYHDQRRAELRAALYAGIAIRDAREEAGLSQTELAARIGIAAVGAVADRSGPSQPDARDVAARDGRAWGPVDTGRGIARDRNPGGVTPCRLAAPGYSPRWRTPTSSTCSSPAPGGGDCG